MAPTVVPIVNTCSTGYPHDSLADNAAYRHDGLADKRCYRHDHSVDSVSPVAPPYKPPTATKMHHSEGQVG